MSQKTTFFIVTTVKTSNLTLDVFVSAEAEEPCLVVSHRVYSRSEDQHEHLKMTNWAETCSVCLQQREEE
jgi:hypothetical protein